MKVLLITNMYPTVERPYFGIFVKEQVDAIRKSYPDVEYDVYNIEGSGVKGKSKWLSIGSYLKSIGEINQILRKGDYELVHVHYGLSGFYLLNPFHKKTPVIVTLHGGDIQPEQGKQFQIFVTHKILRHSDFAVTLNDRMDKMVHNYIKSTQIIPCAVDIDQFKPPVGEKTKKNKPLIVFPSDRNRTIKNYPLFEKTILILNTRYGIDCDTQEVKNMSRMEVCQLYQEADLMLMTSTSEGSPQVVKEAMACNLPVVTTPVGDVKVLLSGVKGSAVALNHDAEELASLCVSSLGNKFSGITGREKICQLGLDSVSVSHRIYTIYSHICHKNSRI